MFAENLGTPSFLVCGHLHGRIESPSVCLFAVACIPPDCALAIVGRRRTSPRARLGGGPNMLELNNYCLLTRSGQRGISDRPCTPNYGNSRPRPDNDCPSNPRQGIWYARSQPPRRTSFPVLVYAYGLDRSGYTPALQARAINIEDDTELPDNHTATYHGPVHTYTRPGLRARREHCAVPMFTDMRAYCLP